MKNTLIISAIIQVLVQATAFAGDLNVVGNLNVASNLTANVVTLQGAADLSNPVLDFARPGLFYRYTLTNDTTWVFTNHIAGRQIWLEIAQDSMGGWANTWPADLLWPGNSTPDVSTASNQFSVFKILDNGDYWLAQPDGLNYRGPCLTNCETALQFDGSQNYLSSAATSACDNLSTFTIEFWYKSIATSGAVVFIASMDNWQASEGRSGFLFYIVPDGEGGGVICPQIMVYHDGWPGCSDNIPNACDGNWHHLALTAGENGFNLWFDGSDVTPQDAPEQALLTGSSRIFLGAGFDMAADGQVSNHFDGTIDEVRISNTERYTDLFTPDCSLGSDENAILYWKLNDARGGTATDNSGNDRNGALHGSPRPVWADGVTSGCAQIAIARRAMSSGMFTGSTTNATHHGTNSEH